MNNIWRYVIGFVLGGIGGIIFALFLYLGPRLIAEETELSCDGDACVEHVRIPGWPFFNDRVEIRAGDVTQKLHRAYPADSVTVEWTDGSPTITAPTDAPETTIEVDASAFGE